MDWRAAIEDSVRGDLARDAPLAPRTAIRVGGPADLLVRPSSIADVVRLLARCRELGIPTFPLGGGANLLVADRGVRGAVVKLPQDAADESSDGATLVLCAGAPPSRLVARAQRLGL